MDPQQIHFAKEERRAARLNSGLRPTGDAAACVRQNASGICAAACQRDSRRGANTYVLQPHELLL